MKMSPSDFSFTAILDISMWLVAAVRGIVALAAGTTLGSTLMIYIIDELYTVKVGDD